MFDRSVKSSSLRHEKNDTRKTTIGGKGKERFWK